MEQNETTDFKESGNQDKTDPEQESWDEERDKKRQLREDKQRKQHEAGATSKNKRRKRSRDPAMNKLQEEIDELRQEYGKALKMPGVNLNIKNAQTNWALNVKADLERKE